MKKFNLSDKSKIYVNGNEIIYAVDNEDLRKKLKELAGGDFI